MGTRCVWWDFTERFTDFIDGVASPILRNSETGEFCPSNKLPAGALYCSPSSSPRMQGGDGLSVVCVLPGGHHWCIDGRANNCTMPFDKEHRCWVRHGTRGERLTVDKLGHTCAAGGGSIQVPGYHGHLQNGELNP